jgi:antitoxin ParD1/3/4
MNVNLTPMLEKLVQDKVEGGSYKSASEVVREALRLLQEKEQIRKLQILESRKKIDASLDSLRRGRGVDGKTFFKALEREESAREGRRMKRE